MHCKIGNFFHFATNELIGQKHTKKYFVDVLTQRYQKLKWEYRCKQELIKMKRKYNMTQRKVYHFNHV